jgi:hypothetical protein
MKTRGSILGLVVVAAVLIALVLWVWGKAADGSAADNFS